jgi:hypothetical protein
LISTGTYYVEDSTAYFGEGLQGLDRGSKLRTDPRAMRYGVEVEAGPRKIGNLTLL